MPRDGIRGEMPFLDHLEELRWRILWSLLALLAGTVIGWWLVQHYDVLSLLKRPIEPFLPQGKLYMTHPTDAFVTTIKLSVLVGLVLAAPVLVWQGWAFFSPALYQKEKRLLVPVLLASTLLFAAGAALAYAWVLPAAFRILLGFQRADLEPIITVDAYIGFAAQLVLAFGLSFQLPLVILLLAALGVVTPAFLSKNRRYWIVLAAAVAAIITPTPDALTMLIMMVPLILLYEVGIVLARLVSRRPIQVPESGTGGATAVILAALLLGGAGTAGAQVVPRRPLPPYPSAGDTTPARPTVRDTPPAGAPIDTGAARRMGLPTQPSRSLPAPDSVMQELLKRAGFRSTRYVADSLTFHAATRQIDLTGQAVVEREGSTLEADSVRFLQADCRIDAAGEPKLFSEGTVLVGSGMVYNTCERRGIIAEALTKVNQSGVAWFLRGRLEIDSASTRVYAGRSSITSSDLPLPDYHFGASRIKWVTNTLMVARPAVLYVRDVPVLWLPFIFQDLRKGRRSGMLVPVFGLNDIVRTNPGWRREIKNLGYYVVINDYLDARASVDWFSGTSVSANGQLQYRWLNRFVNGSVSATQRYELGTASSRSFRLQWNHQQSFNLRTQLRANVDYATSAKVLQERTVDPYLATASLGSQINFNKQFNWGNFSLGGTRRQELATDVVTQSFPSISLLPAPVNLSHAVTWSPSFSFSTDRTSNQLGPAVVGPVLGGAPTTDSLRFFTQSTTASLGTSVRIGRFNWPNNVNFLHTVNDRRSAVTVPDPADTTKTLTRYYGEEFSTTIDWNPSISLPTLFSASWRLQPSVGIQNSTGGAFLLRNRHTEGQFVSQGKRVSFNAGISPSLFGFFPGIGPLTRIRHSVSPSVRWSYAPSASVPERYARASDPSGRQPRLRSPVFHTLSFGLSQTFEGKLRPPPGDTLGERSARKVKLLSIQTSGIDYDFEQAKGPGKNGWKTSILTNQFTSDLLPGFSLGTTHELWAGAAGQDSSAFRPFLSRVSARFSVSAATLKGLLGVFTGAEAVPASAGRSDSVPPLPNPAQGAFPTGFDRRPGAGIPGGQRPFAMAVTFDADRQRNPTSTVAPTANRTAGFAVSFSPTPGWSASWDTQYNFVTREFGQHVLRLDRDLRRWHATFAFAKAANGNFTFNFMVSLLDQPDIKFNYDQRTVKR